LPDDCNCPYLGTDHDRCAGLPQERGQRTIHPEVRATKTGHARLVETEAGHRKRTGDTTTVLPTSPTEPMEPNGTTISNTMYRMYGSKLETYEIIEHCDQEIINVLQVKFPTGLTDLEIEEGMLPLGLGTMATKAYLDLVKSKRDQLSAAVVKSGLIDDAFIILCAQYAFMESGHYKEYICAIDVGWATADAAYETVQGTVAYQETLFRRFQDYYNSRQKNIR